MRPPRAALWPLVPIAGTMAAPVTWMLVHGVDRGYIAAGEFRIAGAGFAGLTQLRAHSPILFVLTGATIYASGIVAVRAVSDEPIMGAQRGPASFATAAEQPDRLRAWSSRRRRSAVTFLDRRGRSGAARSGCRSPRRLRGPGRWGSPAPAIQIAQKPSSRALNADASTAGSPGSSNPAAWSRSRCSRMVRSSACLICASCSANMGSTSPTVSGDGAFCEGRAPAGHRHMIDGRAVPRAGDLRGSGRACATCPLRRAASRTVRFSENHAPTLVVHGERDPLFSPGHEQVLQMEIPGAALLIMQEAGHELPPPVRD